MSNFQVTFDAAEPMALAEFWAEALGYVLQPPPPGFDSWDAWADANSIPLEDRTRLAAIVDPTGNGPRVLFQRVPEGKTAKNRVHLDVNVASDETTETMRKAAVEAMAERLEALGATRLESHHEFGSYWTVMQDIEGNEFCLQ